MLMSGDDIFRDNALAILSIKAQTFVSQALLLSGQREICLSHQLKGELPQTQRNHYYLNSKLALPHVAFETTERAFLW